MEKVQKYRKGEFGIIMEFTGDVTINLTQVVAAPSGETGDEEKEKKNPWGMLPEKESNIIRHIADVLVENDELSEGYHPKSGQSNTKLAVIACQMFSRANMSPNWNFIETLFDVSAQKLCQAYSQRMDGMNARQYNQHLNEIFDRREE